MPNLHEIIAQIQRELHCPICGKKYEVREIKLKGIIGQSLMIQTTCQKGHMTLFVTTIKKVNNSAPINSNDVIELFRAIKNFDGDFHKLWKQLP